MVTRKQIKDPEYEREELLQNCEALFHCKSEVLQGALHGNDQQVLSLKETKKLLNSFLKRRVF